MSDGGTRAPFKVPPPPATARTEGLSTTVYLAAGADLPSRLAAEANAGAWIRQQLPRVSMTVREAMLKQLPTQRIFAFELRLELAGEVETVIRPL